MLSTEKKKIFALKYVTGSHCTEQFYIHQPLRQIPPDRWGVALDFTDSDAATSIYSLYRAKLSGPLVQQHMDLGRAYSVL